MQNTFHLFVYGSLRSGFKNTAYSYISRHFTLVDANATVKGKLADMGDYPVAVPSNDYIIRGELYCINHPDEFAFAIAQLDDYEGVHQEADEPTLYIREKTTVYYNNTTTEAWIYWYAQNVDGKPVIESGDVLAYLAHKLH